MEKNTTVDPLQFDKRVMMRFVKKGALTNKEVESHLENLPDLSDKFDDISEVVYEHFDESEEN